MFPCAEEAYYEALLFDAGAAQTLPRRLTARHAESEHPGAEINHSASSIATKFAKTAI
jgi:hypothetical protein